MSGADWYPPASRVQDFSRAFLGSPMRPNVLLLHSTEGTSWPSYDGGGSAPHLTYQRQAPAGQRWRQHFALSRSARALANTAGGVETNTANVVQVELVGTCDPKNKTKPGWLWVPGADDEMITDLARFWVWLHQQWPVPLTSTLRWLAYPGSYGDSAVRMSGEQWTRFTGLCGHQHAPEQTHGDPGDFPAGRLAGRAKRIANPPPPVTEPAMSRGQRVDDAIALLNQARELSENASRDAAITDAVAALRTLEQRPA